MNVFSLELCFKKQKRLRNKFFYKHLFVKMSKMECYQTLHAKYTFDKSFFLKNLVIQGLPARIKKRKNSPTN